MKILKYDPQLAPFKRDIELREENYSIRQSHLCDHRCSLSEFANGYLFYGFHKTEDGWVYREWAPNAEKMFLTGDFNNWNRQSHPMKNIGGGNFEIHLSKHTLVHGGQVKVHICTHDNSFDRIPLYIRRAIQQPDLSFNGEIWYPNKSFQWTDKEFNMDRNAGLIIYECHVGISSEEYHVSTFNAFTENVLPHIKRIGYNTVQLMAIMEHPYYGSFGYQVSNFFAVSSRFGTPDDLKNLINTAHHMGIAVLLDLVHSHAASNIEEGIAEFDGTQYQFFQSGDKGNHPVWGTKLFNYGKPEVIHFLLSNLKFWLDEYHIDGFRFDGVTSMLYHNHGMEVFDGYQKYFSLNTDIDAVTYLQLATELCKEVKPDCVLIAEDMSGMPGMCIPVSDGGIGFDYRLSMGITDYWINTICDKRDEDWDLGHLWHELTQRRPHEKVIGYCESHDQALVGGKTIMFWLADQEMYQHMRKDSKSHVIERSMALHKMIRLITCMCAGEGYLNFMGNEFGHPEWIDFPREGNGWSFQYARRQWDLVNDNSLRYQYLLAFDKAMITILKVDNLLCHPVRLLLHDEEAKVLIFLKGMYLLAFNFHPSSDYSGSISLDFVTSGSLVLHSNWDIFGGTIPSEDKGDLSVVKQKKEVQLKISISSRTSFMYKLQ